MRTEPQFRFGTQSKIPLSLFGSVLFYITYLRFFHVQSSDQVS